MRKVRIVHLKSYPRNSPESFAVAKDLLRYFLRITHHKGTPGFSLCIEMTFCNGRPSTFSSDSCKGFCITGIIIVNRLFGCAGNVAQRMQSHSQFFGCMSSFSSGLPV